MNRHQRTDADKTVLENHTLTQADDEKFSKLENNHVAIGLAFFPFVPGCFGGIGSQAARFLCALAFLELRQHDDICQRAGLAPLSPSDCSGDNAPSFALGVFDRRQSGYFAALAKATVMSLT